MIVVSLGTYTLLCLFAGVGVGFIFGIAATLSYQAEKAK